MRFTFTEFLQEGFEDEVKGLPRIYHPSRLKKIKEHPTKLFLDPEKHASLSYKDIIQKVRHYTGKKNFSLMDLQFMLMNEVREILEIEREHKSTLEKLAVEVVLSLPDFKFIVDKIKKGELRIDAKLVDSLNIQQDLEKFEQEQKQQVDDPEVELSLAEILMDENEKKAKMSLANVISQGSGLNAQYAFHLVDKELSAISPDLVKRYGIITSIGSLIYFAAPEIKAVAQNIQAGQVDVDDENDDMVYTIKARAIIFPILIHEIVKGIYQYISLTDGLRGADTFGLDDEISDITIGSSVANLLRDFVGNETEYIPVLVQQMLINLTAEEISNIFKKPTNEAKAIVKDILSHLKESDVDDNVYND